MTLRRRTTKQPPAALTPDATMIDIVTGHAEMDPHWAVFVTVVVVSIGFIVAIVEKHEIDHVRFNMAQLVVYVAATLALYYQMGTLQTTIKTKQGEIAEKQGTIAAKDGIIATKDGEIAEKRGIITAKDAEIANIAKNAKNAASAQQSELNRLRLECHELRVRCDDLERQLKDKTAICYHLVNMEASRPRDVEKFDNLYQQLRSLLLRNEH